MDGTLRSTELLQLGCRQWRPGPAMAVPRTALAAATIQVCHSTLVCYTVVGSTR